MKDLFIVILLLMSHIQASERLIFGAISTVDPEIMKKNMQPLLRYLEEVTGREIEFQTGYDYYSTIEKFVDGTFDFGYIGPAPYIRAKNMDSDSLSICAGLQNRSGDYFHSVIVSKKGSEILTIRDLNDARFAFGSPASTLSYYVPMQMLIDSKVIDEIHHYDFLGRHDIVAQYVIMGKYDAGAIKESVALKYASYLQIIARSEDIPDFMIVVSSKMDKALALKIQQALYNLKDPEILGSIKTSAIGFTPRLDSDYDNLRHIMKKVSIYE